MYKKLMIPSFVFNILLGVFMFVFGGADDSPGAQLLGLIVFTVGVLGLVSLIRSRRQSNFPSTNN